jgi:protein-S-isoprenylcysteine O-methyltransferase Ste14
MLVIRGPYRYVRNPMYLSAILIVCGIGLWLRAASLLLYAVVLAGAYHVFVRYHEEPRLTAQFGRAYATYLKRVPRWWPRLGTLQGRDPAPWQQH